MFTFFLIAKKSFKQGGGKLPDFGTQEASCSWEVQANVLPAFPAQDMVPSSQLPSQKSKGLSHLLFLLQPFHSTSTTCFQLHLPNMSWICPIRGHYPGGPKQQPLDWRPSSTIIFLTSIQPQSNLSKVQFRSRCLRVTPHCLEDKVQAPSMLCDAAPPTPAPATRGCACAVSPVMPSASFSPGWLLMGTPKFPSAGVLPLQDSSSATLPPYWAASPP